MWLCKQYRAIAACSCFAFAALVAGCVRPAETGTLVFPKHFYVEIPFERDNRGIIISTHWGLRQKEYRLYLDNHSPCWVNNAVLYNNTAVYKSVDFVYNTSTADGSVLHGDVYMCDSIRIGGISFTRVPFYNISTGGNADGAIGESIMKHAAWKIDFKNKRIGIASEMDSIKNSSLTTRLPAIFTEKAIQVEMRFSNGNKQKLGLDLGFNGSIILPSAAFMQAIAPHKKTTMEKRKFSTPAGSRIVDDRTAFDRIESGGQYYQAPVSSNRLVTEKLIGLRFFEQFEFVIIDYVNKAVYLSRKRMRG